LCFVIPLKYVEVLGNKSWSKNLDICTN